MQPMQAEEAVSGCGLVDFRDEFLIENKIIQPKFRLNITCNCTISFAYTHTGKRPNQKRHLWNKTK